jgi:hypothetical protein
MNRPARRKPDKARPLRVRPAIARPFALWLTAFALTLGSLGAAAQDQTNNPGSRAAASASNPAAQKRQAIRTLIHLTETARIQDIFSQQFINRIADAVAVIKPDLNIRTLTVIKQESRAVIREHIESGDALYSVLYPVYEKHFNLAELNQLVRFYRSPLGQKLVRTSPELLAETLNLGRSWVLSLLPEIMDRVQRRLSAPDSAGGRAQ